MQLSHKHHYVPEWYQKRFMLDGQTAYYRLDLTPECIKTPSGKVVKKGEVLHKGPGRFFYETDLYTTRYFDIDNDEIEKYLFGKIDTEGAEAIAAMASQNWMREIHPHILNYYEYLDAQRLRTPKGLAWLVKVIKPRSYNELLLKMQEVRRLHCTMWAEASMEVVSAEKSGVKFIVSDNPVTLYNSAFYPGNSQCSFPLDPGIELKGTRTIFPLDLNHCAVITNIEYARSPGKLKADKPRTNPRYFDETIINYDDIIRERSLNEQQVLSINYILKTRAQRYIAAAEEDWLYPEMTLKKKDWGKLDKTFVSKSVKLLGSDREIFIGGKDGRLMATQDEFGRKPKSKKEWEEKERQAQAMHDHVMKLLNPSVA
ncbi:MAG: hypothetical protein ABFR65_03510 [Pseudomonadota bacterium]